MVDHRTHYARTPSTDTLAAALHEAARTLAPYYRGDDARGATNEMAHDATAHIPATLPALRVAMLASLSAVANCERQPDHEGHEAAHAWQQATLDCLMALADRASRSESARPRAAALARDILAAIEP